MMIMKKNKPLKHEKRSELKNINSLFRNAHSNSVIKMIFKFVFYQTGVHHKTTLTVSLHLEKTVLHSFLNHERQDFRSGILSDICSLLDVPN